MSVASEAFFFIQRALFRIGLRPLNEYVRQMTARMNEPVGGLHSSLRSLPSFKNVCSNRTHLSKATGSPVD